MWQAAARAVREFKALRRYYTGDFYALGPYSTAKNVWMAWQFHRADLGEGVIQAFRRQESATATMTCRLRGLKPGATYTLTNLDKPQPMRVTGRDLLDRGLTIHLPQKPAAAVLTYREDH